VNHRLLLALAAVLCVGATPAAASASNRQGAVLSVDRAHHRVRIVDSHHRVHRLRYRGRLARNVTPGRRVSYAARGGLLSRLRPLTRLRRLSFYGRVVSSGARGLALRLNDRGLYRIAQGSRSRSHRAVARAASNVTVGIQGLKPGQVVLVTIADNGSGDIAITIKLVDSAPGDSNQGPTVDDQQVTGTVSAIAADRSSVTVDVPGTGAKTFRVNDPDTLEHISVGDLVDVCYYQDGNELVADDVSAAKPAGSDSSGPATPGDPTSEGDGSEGDSGDPSADQPQADAAPGAPASAGGTDKPGSTKPGSTKPGSTKPGTPKPSNAKPGNSKPGSTKPSNTAPAHPKPGG
jgi:hypothetical protein